MSPDVHLPQKLYCMGFSITEKKSEGREPSGANKNDERL